MFHLWKKYQRKRSPAPAKTNAHPYKLSASRRSSRLRSEAIAALSPALARATIFRFPSAVQNRFDEPSIPKIVPVSVSAAQATIIDRSASAHNSIPSRVPAHPPTATAPAPKCLMCFSAVVIGGAYTEARRRAPSADQARPRPHLTVRSGPFVIHAVQRTSSQAGLIFENELLRTADLCFGSECATTSEPGSEHCLYADAPRTSHTPTLGATCATMTI